jgi:hypothetical protein
LVSIRRFAATQPTDFFLLITPTQLLQLNEQLTPLDFRHPKLLADLIRFFTGTVIVQGARPSAHVEGQVLGQPGFVTNVFQ